MEGSEGTLTGRARATSEGGIADSISGTDLISLIFWLWLDEGIDPPSWLAANLPGSEYTCTFYPICECGNEADCSILIADCADAESFTCETGGSQGQCKKGNCSIK
jgi:hypothetical protein